MSVLHYFNFSFLKFHSSLPSLYCDLALRVNSEIKLTFQLGDVNGPCDLNRRGGPGWLFFLDSESRVACVLEGTAE